MPANSGNNNSNNENNHNLWAVSSGFWATTLAIKHGTTLAMSVAYSHSISLFHCLSFDSLALSTSLTTSLRQLLCHLASFIPVWAPWYDYYYAYKTHKSPTQNVLVRQKTAADFSALINSTHSKLNNKNNIRSDIMNIWEALFNWISFCLSVL